MTIYKRSCVIKKSLFLFEFLRASCFLILIFGVFMQAVAQPIWIDVRGADEYAAGHVQNAILIPHDQIAGRIANEVNDKNTDIHLYCRTGRRADMARDVLAEMGYKNVVNHGSLENAQAVIKRLDRSVER
jgi:phage shock protein E